MYNNETERLFAEGGINDQGGTTDPVSGNDVPPGALKSEVRDDIDAKLSEGEFVFSADVVRYIGLSNLMKIRDKAKEGLSKMEDIGQMGNSEQVADGESLHEDDFEGTIDEVMSEVDQEHEKGFAEGGMVQHYDTGGFAQPGTDYLAKYNIPRTAITNQALDVRGYKNKEGRMIFITFFNGKPSIPIPGGYEYAGTGQELAGAMTAPKTTATTTTDTTGTTTANVKTGGGPGPGGKTGDGTDGSGTGGTGSYGSYSGTRQALGQLAADNPFGGILGFVAKQWGIETVAQENANFRAELDSLQSKLTDTEKTVYALNPLALDPAQQQQQLLEQQQQQQGITTTTSRSMDVGVGKTSGSGSLSSADGKTGSVTVGSMSFGGKDSGDSSGGSTGGGLGGSGAGGTGPGSSGAGGGPGSKGTGSGVGSGGVGPTCFVKGSLVTLADGSKVAIEDVAVGDFVLGQSGPNEVMAHDRPQLIIPDVREGTLYGFNGTKKFITSEHPVMTKAGWKAIDQESAKKFEPHLSEILVGNLEVGDEIIAQKGETLLVASIDKHIDQEQQQLYNLMLDGDHTYYVNELLVHNKDFAKGGLVSKPKKKAANKKSGLASR
jgi:hypothetical protein